ncbi:MAG TPA: phospho-N-acetylmuramoyl-pentapeptide-transferase [Clostridia bacterium]|nr:phospho-N-acetylmuramoyl-pentapeptide-transferase [Clostridia bacterium]
MEFKIKILLLSFVATVISGIIIIPILRKLKIGQIEREDGPNSHLRKQGTPTMGGIIMMAVIAILGGFIYYTYSKTDPILAQKIISLIIITIGCGLIGFMDDIKKMIGKNTKGINPAAKMFGLFAVATLFTMYLLKVQNISTDVIIPFIGITYNLPIWIYIPFTIFVILSVTNSVNLTDGIDGLATSVVIAMALCLTFLSIVLDIKEVTLIGCLILGICSGFLIFNLHPAKVFMGDTGSLLLGGSIAGMAIAMKLPIILLIIAIIPIIEVLSVIIQVIYFKKTGKRIFKMSPFHHHLELSGWKENTIVLVFSIMTVVLGIIAILSV